MYRRGSRLNAACRDHPGARTTDVSAKARLGDPSGAVTPMYRSASRLDASREGSNDSQILEEVKPQPPDEHGGNLKLLVNTAERAPLVQVGKSPGSDGPKGYSGTTNA